MLFILIAYSELIRCPACEFIAVRKFMINIDRPATMKKILKTKTEGICRYFLSTYLSGRLPVYIITEYPKSGGSWFGQMLAEALQIPFPRNCYPGFHSCVMHGHRLYNSRLKNVFVVLRDGRDVMVSFYYHSYFKNERYNERLVEQTKKYCPFKDYNNIRENLPKFIEYKFTSRITTPGFTWSQFVNSWFDKNVCRFVKYENLLHEPVNELFESLQVIGSGKIEEDRLRAIVKKYSFENMSKRKPGTEDKKSFLRKGIAGDWKNYFNREACEIFNCYAGDKLIELGYEKDDSWVYSK